PRLYRRERLAVWRYGNLKDLSQAFLDAPRLASAADVPPAQGLVIASRNQRFAVGEECNRENRPGMSGQSLLRLPCRRVPEVDTLVLPRRGEGLAVRGEGNGEGPIRRPGQPREFLARGHVPKPHRRRVRDGPR